MPGFSNLRAKKKEKNTGLLLPGEPEFLQLGILRKPHGISGEIFLEVLTDKPEPIISGGKYYIGESHLEKKIKAFRIINNGLLVLFEGITCRDEVEEYRNNNLYILTSEIPDLPANEFYYHQIIGMTVVDEKNQMIGTVVDINKTKANDVYQIKRYDKSPEDILIPAIKSVIKKIDLENKKMIISMPEWE